MQADLEANPAELNEAVERAEKAEAELAALKAEQPGHERHVELDAKSPTNPDAEQELRKDSMMAHLFDSLDAGKDIGHYGRLVFAIVARKFMPHEDVLAWMIKDADVTEAKAEIMLRQIDSRGYNPPKREKILEYQKQQEFPILPHPDDPDCGNLYRTLKFPDAVYEHIEEYQEQKLAE